MVKVQFRINKGIEVYDDAIASIKTEGLIGDKYVSIDPGGGGDLLADGDTITDTNAPTDIMDLVSKYAFGDVGGGGKQETGKEEKKEIELNSECGMAKLEICGLRIGLGKAQRAKRRELTAYASEKTRGLRCQRGNKAKRSYDQNGHNVLNDPNNKYDKYESRREASMNKLFTAVILILTVVLVIPLAGYAATPMETVKTGVDKVLATLTDPGFKAKPKDQQVAQLTDAINTIFDFEELSKRTLGKGWKNMNDAQQKEFVQLFTELLQGVYADRLLAYSDQKILFDKEDTLKKGIAEVQSYLQTSDGKKIPLFYRLTDKSGSWKVYDVIIEGVSMVKNYRTQFREILAKDSPEKLLEILRSKVGKG